MASSYSFDIVSDFDHQELVNAIDQTRREIVSRYDLKSTKTEVELEKESITINTNSEMTLTSVVDVMQSKAIKRGLSLKIFDYGEIESASGSRVVQKINLKKGIEQDQAKKLSKIIRDAFPKAQASIQGDALRVTSKSKDELQEIIQLVKSEDFPLALQFINYR
ncbi:MAG: YajQ family cyclic di-GMP-binding protein [Pseudanabaena frigida]|uniref:Nucleotide-binding protein DCF19_09275 n=1 Tax=Pseudanabaena frigida TaxID=945775 RepID=A0A2W4Y404_9CYAN|nr:MAG: YajQ family cyclic di-GMP-binding protein [Pseudanabaena frigida]